jgi:LDH2 family malate/lactate/ureidoglycolate dehydrogenase
MIREVKSTPPLPGFDEVMYPGEPEYRVARKKKKEGIFIEDKTWNALQDLMNELGVSDKVGSPD